MLLSNGAAIPAAPFICSLAEVESGTFQKKNGTNFSE